MSDERIAELEVERDELIADMETLRDCLNKEVAAREIEAAGWQLVPIEPTEAMLKAATWALDKWREECSNVQQYYVAPHIKYRVRWAAMLAAAPSPEDKS